MAQHLFLLCLALLTAISVECRGMNLDTAAESALLINADTGAILFEKEADKLQFPASTTKIATVLYALNRGKVSLDTLVTAEGDALTPTTEAAKKRGNYAQPAYWLETDGCHISIKPGEQLPLRDLLYGMLLRSANDASNVVAYYIGGSIPEFMKELNSYLREIGCTSTTFTNPHGLHHPDHQTTARDLARMTGEALKIPLFAEMVSTLNHTRPKTNLQEPTTLVHTNRLLRKGGPNYYAKAIGVKTGYHARAQHNIVAAARDEAGRTLILVLMHLPDRKAMFQEVKLVFEAAFHEPKVERTLLPAGAQKFALKLPGSLSPIATYLPEAISYAYYPAEEPQFKALIFWDDVALPVQKDQRLGEIRFFAENENDRLLLTTPVYAAQSVRQSPWHRLSAVVSGNILILFSLFGIAGIGIVSVWRWRSW